MKHYLLDTNAVIALLKGNSNIAQRLRQCSPEAVSISAIVTYELSYGAFKSQRVQKNIITLENLQFTVLPFDQTDARHAGYIRAQLALQGRIIGPYDVLIAGQAKARGIILVTQNLQEFKRVEGLYCEDWSE